jgi:hypothetical protein
MIQVPLHDQLAVAINVHVARRMVAFPVMKTYPPRRYLPLADDRIGRALFIGERVLDACEPLEARLVVNVTVRGNILDRCRRFFRVTLSPNFKNRGNLHSCEQSQPPDDYPREARRQVAARRNHHPADCDGRTQRPFVRGGVERSPCLAESALAPANHGDRAKARCQQPEGRGLWHGAHGRLCPVDRGSYDPTADAAVGHGLARAAGWRGPARPDGGWRRNTRGRARRDVPAQGHRARRICGRRMSRT